MYFVIGCDVIPNYVRDILRVCTSKLSEGKYGTGARNLTWHGSLWWLDMNANG